MVWFLRNPSFLHAAPTIDIFAMMRMHTAPCARANFSERGAEHTRQDTLRRHQVCLIINIIYII